MPYLLYKGPSELDGKKIIVLATGIENPSSNAKTGAMIQTYILRDDILPSEAVKLREDVSICGDCVHRGATPKERSCYVVPFMGPNGVWRAYKNSPTPIITDLEDLGWLEDIRLGAYGDPAAVPIDVWERLTKKANGFTGYTHQWKNCDPKLKKFCMASVDSNAEHLLATSAGWRTFRVKRAAEPLTTNETICPATITNNKAQCKTCLACAGTSRQQNNIAVDVHGAKWIQNNFNTRS